VRTAVVIEASAVVFNPRERRRPRQQAGQPGDVKVGAPARLGEYQRFAGTEQRHRFSADAAIR